MDEDYDEIKKSWLGKIMGKWKCPRCGDVEESDTQPYCKTCSHIERLDVKMEKLENK